MTPTLTDPAAVDRALAGIYTEQARIRSAIAGTFTSLHRHLGERSTFTRGAATWPTTDAEAEAAARTGKGVDHWRATLLGLDLADLERLRRHLGDLSREAAPLEDEYEQRAWSRFYIVPGGHIHSGRGCHTLRPTTSIGWLPDLSGQTEETAVKEHGPLLCSVCFPTAPVEWTVGKNTEPDYCPGAGTGADDIRRVGTRRYATCPACGAVQLVNPSSLTIRKHKAPAR